MTGKERKNEEKIKIEKETEIWPYWNDASQHDTGYFRQRQLDATFLIDASYRAVSLESFQGDTDPLGSKFSITIK